MDSVQNVASENKKALYVHVYETLYKMIMEGSFPSNQLPSEPRLAEMLGVSRMTLRQAISLLRDDGLINNVRGKGNFITTMPLTQAAGGLEKLGNPIRKCCTVEIDNIEVESRIDFPNDYMLGVLDRLTTAVIVFHRWYQHKGQYIGYSISFIPIETMTTFKIDTSQQERIAEFLETGVYDFAHRSTLKIQLSETGEFISDKHVISNKKALNLITERLYGEVKIPLLVSKHYLNMDICNMVVHAEIPAIKPICTKNSMETDKISEN